MKNRLEQLLNGQFEYDLPHMQLSGRTVRIETEAGGHAKGAFIVTHPEEGKVRGFLNTDNPRILLESPEFYGHENVIRFDVDTEGLQPGETTEGTIFISSGLGQDQVRVTVHLREQEAPEPYNEQELVDAARKDFAAAASLFSSPAYRARMMLADAPARALYSGLEGEKNPLRRLEEFLVGTGAKESVDISCDWTGRKLVNPEGTLREPIRLTASTWGYLEIHISSDAQFLRPEKKTLTTEEFAGGSCEAGLIIDSNFLHAGKNYGRVTIRTSYKTMELEVRADRIDDGEARRLHRVRCLMRKKALNLYLDYRAGRVDLHNWASRTDSVLNAYRRAQGRDVYADLFSIFILQADGRRREAERLLAELEKTPQRLNTPDRYVFYLFLTSFFTRDSAYLDAVRKEVQRLAAENPSSWQIRWVCLYLFEDTAGGEELRLDAVTRQIELGCSSPVMYLEGALVLRKKPSLFHEITPAIRLILNFAARQGLLTEQLFLKLASIQRRSPHYDPVLYKVLADYARKSGAREALTALCAMAIEGGQKSRRFFPLFQVAVMKEVSVTGLYEYYMDACEEYRIETMPEVIRRYFVYNDTLDWHKKARIFRNMADGRGKIPGIFSSMKPAIGTFLTDQLAQSHIDSDLAALYSEFLTRPMLTDRLAANLLRLLFTYRVECLSPGMKKIILVDSRMQQEREVPLKNAAALVRIYSDQTRILLGDGEGRRYASTSLYMADHFLESPELLEMCAEIVPDAPELALFYTLNTVRDQPVNAVSLRYFRKASGMRRLSADFRKTIRSWLLDYYTGNPDDPSLDDFLKEADLYDYAEAGLEKLQGLLTGEGLFEEAYRLVLKYGHDHTPLSLLVRICSQMVLESEYQEDEKLLGYCSSCFFSGKYDKNILTYLLMYPDGSIPEMKKLWKAGKEYGLDTMKLEEHILSMIVFEREGMEESEPIYASYRASLGNRRLCQGYVILMSYGYMVRNLPADDVLFEDLLADFERGGNLPDVCALALLKHLSGLGSRNEAQNEAARRILERYENRNMRFSFFAAFPEPLHAVSGIREMVFFEYTASPKSTVTLSFRRKGSGEAFQTETMQDLFCGIRVREFILFGAQELECFTEEERADGTRIISGVHTLKAAPIPDDEKETRYGRLSALSDALARGDREEAREILMDLRRTETLTAELFTLI